METAKMQGEKEYELAVVIGRFQPFHNGHLALLRQAAGLSGKVLAVLGSAQASGDEKNPLDAAQRECMVRSVWQTEGIEGELAIESVKDCWDNEQWAREIRALARKALGKEGKVALCGFEKDATSAYLRLFSDWDLQPAVHVDLINATDLRKLWLSREGSAGKMALARSMMPQAAWEFIDAFRSLPAFGRILERAQRHEEAKALHGLDERGRLAAIAMVFCGDKVLLAREAALGDGALMGLPFAPLGPRQRAGACALECAKAQGGLETFPSTLAGRFEGIMLADHPDRALPGRQIGLVYIFRLHGPEPELRPNAGKWVDAKEAAASPELLAQDHAHLIGRALQGDAGLMSWF